MSMRGGRPKGLIAVTPYPVVLTEAATKRTICLAQTAKELGVDVWVAAPGTNLHPIPFKGIKLPTVGRVELGKSELLETFRIVVSSISISLNLIIRRRAIGLVQFAQSGQPLYNIVNLFVSKLLGLKIVYVMDDLTPEYVGLRYRLSKTSPRLRALFFFEKLICASTDLVVVVSASMARVLSRSSPRRVVVVYNAVILGELAAHESSNSSIPDDLPTGFRVVYFGRIGKAWGGLEEAIYAMAHLRGPFSLIIIGEGDARRSLQVLIRRLGLEERVIIIGPYPTESLYAIVRKCDLVFIAGMTDWEGHRIATPTKLFEAVALGKPVVCPDTPGLREVLDKIGSAYYYDKSPESIARAIAKAYNDKLTISKRSFGMTEDSTLILSKYRDLSMYREGLSELLRQ